MDEKEIVVIVGAGPAGLTAAYELSTRSDKKVIVVEADTQVGGISKTVDYKGNKIDIGGHRFFSKSDWVLDWWQKFLPVLSDENTIYTTYQNQYKTVSITAEADPSQPHMMIRPRKSRILYRGKLFDYPIKLSIGTLNKLGWLTSLEILFSLLKSRLFPISEEKNLEDFYINRFGYKLYSIFFRDYTQKVWGKHCSEISAEWGYQRVKELSFRQIIKHHLTTLFYPEKQKFGNKETVQTLTEYFMYPQKGPGQLWEEVARQCVQNGVEIRLGHKATQLNTSEQTIKIEEVSSGAMTTLKFDAFISTMPMQSLIKHIQPEVPKQIHQIASNLEYRDFLIVGLLLKDLKLKDHEGKPIKDNWLYIQEGHVKVGRMQLFHNWSPWMVADEDTAWIGAEYFCQEGDELWNLSDQELIQLATDELSSIGMIHKSNVLDGTVVRMPKAYPSYVGSYGGIDALREYLDAFHNIYLIGRNGTHRYNNQDHSMLTAYEAVKHLLGESSAKTTIWDVNTEQEYHEEIKRS